VTLFQIYDRGIKPGAHLGRNAMEWENGEIRVPEFCVGLGKIDFSDGAGNI
jgi:hypothetical protein